MQEAGAQWLRHGVGLEIGAAFDNRITEMCRDRRALRYRQRGKRGACGRRAGGAPVHRVDFITNHRAGDQCGAQHAGAGVVEGAIGVDRVAQAGGDGGLLVGREFTKRPVVTDGGNRDRAAERQPGVVDNGAQAGAQGTGVERVDRRGDGRGVAAAGQGLARQGVEVVGKIVLHFASIERDAAGHTDDAAEQQLARRDDR